MAAFIGRREFITLLGGAAAACPFAARAQQPERMRRIAVLMGTAETPLDKTNITVFLSRLNELGWKPDGNLLTDVRWWISTPERMREVIAAGCCRRIYKSCACDHPIDGRKGSLSFRRRR
jgi:hypothetical protein